MIDKSRKLTRSLASTVWLSCRLRCMEYCAMKSGLVQEES
jgi:hypothetical protein